MPQSEFHHQLEPDHIRASQHLGRTTEDNLAFACFRCNRLKEPNLTSVDPETDSVARLSIRARKLGQNILP
jgi:5-methylcytosine-specific restriction endonuclease McrA